MLLKKSTLQEFHVSVLRIQKFVLNNHWILNARDTAVEVENNKLEKKVDTIFGGDKGKMK